MIDLWFGQELKSILDTKSVAVFVDESGEASGIGSAVYICIVSVLYKKNLKPGLAVLGNILVGGAIERATSFAEKVTMLSANGAKTVIVPMDNLAEIANVPPSVLGDTDVPFYHRKQKFSPPSQLPWKAMMPSAKSPPASRTNRPASTAGLFTCTFAAASSARIAAAASPAWKP